jgi:hypothetical protein
MRGWIRLLTVAISNMKRSLRQNLADSHVAAVMIALLLLWSFDGAFHALWEPASRAIQFLITAIAIFDIPSHSATFNRVVLLTAAAYSYGALASFLGAWFLSRWVYGMGPFRSLALCFKDLIVRKHA